MIATSPDPVGAFALGNAPTASGNLRFVKPERGPETGPAATERARELFLQAWALMENNNRTEEESERMINSAHASRYYWEEAGTVVNRAVAEWLLSRCYVVLGRAEPALYHARRCETLSASADATPLCRAYAQEALTRAYLLGRHPAVAADTLTAAESLADKLSSADSFYIGQELKALREVLKSA